MFNHRMITGVLCLMAAAPLAKAGPQEDAMIQQIKQIASQGQDPQTAAQVSQYVDQNKALITSILHNSMQVLAQLQSISTDGTAPTPLASASPQAAQQDPSAQPQPQQNAAPQQQAQGPETAQAIQTAVLQTGTLEASGGLQTAHLTGYPALPTAPPVSAVQYPTAEQLDHAASVQKEMQARKQYLMEHPEGYTY
ncbi:MAG TPA: hypothetical protein VHY22_15135 [Chthoniobacteraceae bacterium]|jgi:hypothetical protein|nr:hypothetical protein [Chthoniobacteraceae bacterium]